MQDLDYLLEVCQLAALIFRSRVFHRYLSPCAIIVQLRCQSKELLLEKESQVVREIYPRMQRGYYTCAVSLGGSHSQDDEGIGFFAKRVAMSPEVWQVQGLAAGRRL